MNAADASTRHRVLELIAEDGPISASELAEALDVTPAGIRRHLAGLADDGLIFEQDVPGTQVRGRGRPARSFVVSAQGQAQLTPGYRDLATEALSFIAELDPEGVARFAEEQFRALEADVAPAIAAGHGDVHERVEALADELTKRGYAASVRPVPGTVMTQLCQGHCPIPAAAALFPQICEAETAAFSRLLGVHVQRLSTIATGMHVCTTNVPTGVVTKGIR